jgi:hypothetical protein
MRKHLTLIILFFTITLHSVDAQAQLEASYAINTNTSNCINISLENKSADTFYIITQQYAFAGGDSCFAYDIYLSEHSDKRLTLDITYIHQDIDHAPSCSFYISPGSTYKIGAKVVNKLKDNLYVSMYVYAMPISPDDSKEATRQKLTMLIEAPLKQLWIQRQSETDTNPSGLRSYYCKQQN